MGMETWSLSFTLVVILVDGEVGNVLIESKTEIEAYLR